MYAIALLCTAEEEEKGGMIGMIEYARFRLNFALTQKRGKHERSSLNSCEIHSFYKFERDLWSGVRVFIQTTGLVLSNELMLKLMMKTI